VCPARSRIMSRGCCGPFRRLPQSALEVTFDQHPLSHHRGRDRPDAGRAPAAPAGRASEGARQCRARQAGGQQPGRVGQGPPAMGMIRRAEERGDIKPGDTLIEATSGNTGIALAMAAAIRGYRMVLIMPEDLSIERVQTMKAFGAELILTPKSGGMEYARDLAEQMQRDGKGRGAGPVRQRRQPAHPLRDHRARDLGRHPRAGDPLRQRHGHHRHHHRRVALPQGTEPGTSRSSVRSLRRAHAFPASASGPRSTCPRSTTPRMSTNWCYVSQVDAEEMCRRMAREEGIFRRHLGRWRLLGGPADGPQVKVMRPSCSSSATVATATCRPVSSRPDPCRCRRLKSRQSKEL
jgi:cysteine synthase B